MSRWNMTTPKEVSLLSIFSLSATYAPVVMSAADSFIEMMQWITVLIVAAIALEIIMNRDDDDPDGYV